MLIMAFAAVSSIALPLKGHMISNMQEQIPSDDCCCSAAFYSVPLGACFASVFTSLAHDLTEASQALTPSTPTTPRGAARRAVLRKNPRSPRLGLVLSLSRRTDPNSRGGSRITRCRRDPSPAAEPAAVSAPVQFRLFAFPSLDPR